MSADNSAAEDTEEDSQHQQQPQQEDEEQHQLVIGEQFPSSEPNQDPEEDEDLPENSAPGSPEVRGETLDQLQQQQQQQQQKLEQIDRQTPQLPHQLQLHHHHRQNHPQIEVERSCMETRGRVSVKWDITRKNKTSIVIDGYKMTESRAGKDGRVFWRCSKRFCSATAISLGPRLISVRQVDSRRFHNHPPTGKEEFFRVDFCSPGTPTQVTIKWPVTRLSLASTGAGSESTNSDSGLQGGVGATPVDGILGDPRHNLDADDDEVLVDDPRSRDPELLDAKEDLGSADEDSDLLTMAPAQAAAVGAGAGFSPTGKQPPPPPPPPLMLAGARQMLQQQQQQQQQQPFHQLQRLNDPLGHSNNHHQQQQQLSLAVAAAAAAAAAAASSTSSPSGFGGGIAGGSGGGAGLQALAAAAGLHGNFPSALQQQQHQHQRHQHPVPDPAALLASLEAQKAMLALALAGGGSGAGGGGGGCSGGPQRSPIQLAGGPLAYSHPIFSPLPHQHRQHQQQVAFSAQQDAAAVSQSPLKEALSQVDNSQLRRQLRRLEGYFRTGIVAVSESILRCQQQQQQQQQQQTKEAGAERDTLLRLFNYMEGLERVHKLSGELP